MGMTGMSNMMGGPFGNRTGGPFVGSNYDRSMMGGTGASGLQNMSN
jgi:hypothetical protein